MTSPCNRRRFLQLGSLGLGGAITASQAAWAKTLLPGTEKIRDLDFRREPDEVVDVAIIGGGISGLTAAWTLKKLGRTQVKVLEVRDRVGGRTLNEASANNGYVELGGQWVGPTQDAVMGLMGQLGIGRFPTYNTGRQVDQTDSLGPLEILDYLNAVRKIDSLSKQVPRKNPWNASNAALWDSMTVRDWMNQNMSTTGAKQIIEITVQSDFGGSTRDVSLLWFLFYVHSATDFNTMADKAQRWRIEGGSQTICFRLAQKVRHQVELNAGVDGIMWRTNGALIRYGGRHLIAARKVIIAMMPRDAANIRYFPHLPAQRDSLQRNWNTGHGDKYFAVYQTPFWRQQGLSGSAVSDNEFILLAWDNTPSTGHSGVLGGFAVLEGSQRPPTRALRRQLVLRSFASFFGPQAWNAIGFHEHSWELDPHTEGCVSPMEPGLLTAHGPALREPVGPIHWAGTETSTVWCGYMDGAVRAGKRAAEEVDLALG
ncbi:MAG: FAD-dependent oxidoreductase [Planctomycetota bacterium]